MCLYNPKQISLKKDLIAYKVITITNDNKLLSPYFNDFTWELNQMYSINTQTPDILQKHDLKLIKGNAFHTFKNLKDAKEFRNHNNTINYFHNKLNFGSSQDIKEYAVFKCIIPKSSNFVYEGFNGLPPLDTPSFASEKLILLEKIS